jgi:hypothetical protein
VGITYQSLLLFILNLLDAGLTLFWTRLGLAEEANHLMAFMLESGSANFLTFKLCVGLLAALCFYRWAYLPAARLGLRLALGVYVLILAIHLSVGALVCGAGVWLGF